MARTPRQPRVLFTPWGNGTGHVMRAVALARHACSLGWRATVAVGGDGLRDLAHARGIDTVNYDDGSSGLDPWLMWTDAGTWLAATSADRLLIREADVDLVVNDGRLSMAIAAHIEGVPLTGIVQDMDFPLYSYPGRAPERLWHEMRPAARAALDTHQLRWDFDDPRELIVAGGVVIPGTPESDQPPPAQSASQSFVGPLTGHDSGHTGQGAVMAGGVLFYKTLGPGAITRHFRHQFADLAPKIYIATGSPERTEILRSELHGFGAHVADMWEVAPDPDDAPALAIIHGGHGTMLHMAQAGVPAVILPDRSPERYANALKALEIPSMTAMTSHMHPDDLSWSAQGNGIPDYDPSALRDFIDELDLPALQAAARVYAQRLEGYSLEAAWRTIVECARVPRVGWHEDRADARG